MIKLNAKQLRVSHPDLKIKKSIRKNDIFIVCDNVLDTYNIGSIFRLADAVAARKVYLCGQTLTPPNSRIKKASINTWKWVDWEYTKSAVSAISKLKNPTHLRQPADSEDKPKLDIQTVVIEQHQNSIPFYTAEYKLPLILVVGNETYGVSKDVLKMADRIVEIPMWGVNKSLNVMVSLGIVLYEVTKPIASDTE